MFFAHGNTLLLRGHEGTEYPPPLPARPRARPHDRLFCTAEPPQQENTVAVVFSFMLTPYTSFWQPEQPTYNPIEACFQLMHPQIDGGKTPYYESPRFFVDPHMKVRLL